jgi:hypothetical protein
MKNLLKSKMIEFRYILLIIFCIIFALGDAIFVIFIYKEFSDNILSSNGAVLGVFVSLVVIGVLTPSLLFIYVYKLRHL